MSIYSQRKLDDGVVTGFAEEGITAWHQSGIDVQALIDLGRAFNGPVPAETAERLLGWEPVVIELPAITDITGKAYTLPDRLSKFIAHPNTDRIINIAGSGFNPNLHKTMRDAIQAAVDAECDIASVVCLGDGAHMGMSFRMRDTVTVGGDWGGATPLVGFNSSLTSAIATSMDTSTVLRVCDNTMAWAARSAKNTLKVKRTRNSDDRVTPSSILEALDLSFADTSNIVAMLERLANVAVSDAQLWNVLNVWKPVPAEDGRAKTIALNQRNEFSHLFLDDGRNVFGESAAGLWQTHNTWAHWSQTMRGFTDDKGVVPVDARLQRKAIRTMDGSVDELDRQFMAIVGAEFDLNEFFPVGVAA